ncbi:MAG: hypothetical protein HOP30_11475 [Cyclobacteriaceae bacterium]|nr:hypothetical protein [Cyclobacteriaceae bacterium]
MKKWTILTFLFSVLLQIGIAQEKKEKLKTIWPEEHKWKVGSDQEDKAMHVREWIPGNESHEHWTILGTMISITGAQNVPMENIMMAMYEQVKLSAPKSTVTEIEKDETGKHHWIVFKIESHRFHHHNTPESRLYYAIQGDSSLYVNIVSIKEKTLSHHFIEKWWTIFKASQLVYE